ncbi:MAG: DNA repair protein RadA [Elusimicrobia bacterium]|nr:DNA repair protein RadA [Elusimicrobiota bacterium]
MAQDKIVFCCQECGYESINWLGQCPDCGKWNTLVEEKVAAPAKHKANNTRVAGAPQTLAEIKSIETDRIATGIGEFDRIVGGGVVPGSLVLIGGAPGIGKSTLLLQVAQALNRQGAILYISGEESPQQIKLRAQRLGVDSEQLYLVSETNIQQVIEYCKKLNPKFLIIDSIQTLSEPDLPSAPGSVGQVRECTLQLMNVAKGYTIATFICGHVTKVGEIAGPRVLEHMVDTVLYFEGDAQHNYRILRAVKNRFGATNEIGIFSMQEKGLIEVLNPSEVLLSERNEAASGTVVVVSLEGTRPLLVELQSLVTSTYLPVARRQVQGLDYNRVLLLLAVMEKRLGLHLGSQDVFVNVVSGLEIDEPASDLGLVGAVASALRNVPVDKLTAIMGEVGLSGEVRAINFAKERVQEAAKLGFKQAVIPAGNLKEAQALKNKIDILAVKSIREAIDFCLKK